MKTKEQILKEKLDFYCMYDEDAILREDVKMAVYEAMIAFKMQKDEEVEKPDYCEINCIDCIKSVYRDGRLECGLK